jgi:hypothetical protein
MVVVNYHRFFYELLMLLHERRLYVIPAISMQGENFSLHLKLLRHHRIVVEGFPYEYDSLRAFLAEQPL